MDEEKQRQQAKNDEYAEMTVQQQVAESYQTGVIDREANEQSRKERGKKQ